MPAVSLNGEHGMFIDCTMYRALSRGYAMMNGPQAAAGMGRSSIGANRSIDLGSPNGLRTLCGYL